MSTFHRTVNYICHLHLSIPRSLPLRSSVPYPLCLPSISAPTMSRDQKRIWCCICLLNHLIVAGCFILISMLLDHLHIMSKPCSAYLSQLIMTMISFPYIRHVYHTHDAYQVIYYLPCRRCYASNFILDR